MSARTMLAVGGVILGILLLLLNPWVGAVIIAAAIAIPVVTYLMLDPSQRKRVRRAGRKQIGR
jgi:4-hydroxybenzoate polyprenyltransferase